MKRHYPEAALQRSIVQYLSVLEKQGKLFFFAIPNSGGRGLAKRGAMLKSMGLKAGVPDICIVFHEHGGPRIMFVELKSSVGKLSAAQTDIAWKLARYCGESAFHIVRSLDQMIALCKAWGLVK